MATSPLVPGGRSFDMHHRIISGSVALIQAKSVVAALARR